MAADGDGGEGIGKKKPTPFCVVARSCFAVGQMQVVGPREKSVRVLRSVVIGRLASRAITTRLLSASHAGSADLVLV